MLREFIRYIIRRKMKRTTLEEIKERYKGKHSLLGVKFKTVGIAKPRKMSFVIVKCFNCGKITERQVHHLLNSKHNTCNSCSTRGRKKVHGGAGTRLYRVWRSMRERCNNKANKRYHRYGERGIKVLFKDFVEFREWALANGFQEVQTATEFKDYQSLDRIDVDKHYSADNCQFITVSENTAKAHSDKVK